MGCSADEHDIKKHPSLRPMRRLGSYYRIRLPTSKLNTESGQSTAKLKENKRKQTPALHGQPVIEIPRGLPKANETSSCRQPHSSQLTVRSLWPDVLHLRDDRRRIRFHVGRTMYRVPIHFDTEDFSRARLVG